VGIDKYTIIHPIFGHSIIQTSAFLVSVAFPEANFYETAEQYGKKCSQPYESHSDFIKNRQAAMTTH
jgi:hypothetical protein